MPDKAWKAEERKVAKAFGCKRALMKGTDEKSDIDHPLFCVDVKLRKNWQLESWFNVLRTYARSQDKIPILTLRKPRSKRRLAVVDFDFLIAALKGAELLDEKGIKL